MPCMYSTDHATTWENFYDTASLDYDHCMIPFPLSSSYISLKPRPINIRLIS
jgi:hypothetical protein